MKELKVQRVESPKDLEGAAKEPISHLNWSNDFPYKPEAYFQMGYSDTHLYIKYSVAEGHIKATALNDNESVCKDSCVEIFVQPAGSDYYYNLEFNCIGTALAARRITRPNAERFTAEKLKQIERTSSLPFAPIDNSDGGEWSLTISIPFQLLDIAPSSAPPKTMRANIYKCGDETNQPHYVSWSEILTDSPNFHQPQYFGTLIFE